MTYYVYALYRLDGTPFYVGSGSGNRWYSHDFFARNGVVAGNPAKHRIICAIQRKGWSVPKRKLGEYQTKAEADAHEIRLIRLWKRRYRLTNRTDGGTGGATPYTTERRRKVSQALKGVPKSAEARRNMSIADKKRPWNPQAIAAMTKANRGRKLSVEHRQKISRAMKKRRSK